VTVQVGQMTTLLPHLKTGSATATIEVTAEAPVLNFESPDFSSNLNQKAMQDIPVNNRRWSALAMTTPGVVSDSNGFGLVSVRGISPILNNVLIDGADDNQAYYSEERGRTREAYSTSENAVREFAVNTGVYPAEYGRAAGAVINSVTKSGTNELHGQAYFYDRESKWNAFNDYTKLTTLNPTTGAYVAEPLKPKDLRKIYGFTVGGALIKDKLFWIYTFDQHHRLFPGIGVPSSPGTFYTLPSATLPSTVTCSNTGNGYLVNNSADPNAALDEQACLLAARQGVSYAAAVTLWDNGIAGMNSDLGNVPRFGDQEINTPKLDWQINDKERLSVLYHRLRWDSPGGVQTQAALDYAVDTWGNDFVKLDYGLTKLSSLITSNMSNELLYQYGRELDDESQQPYSPYTLSNFVGTSANSVGNVPEVSVDTSVFANMGSPYYSYRKALPDERKWQIGDVLHLTKGNHTFTFGGDAVHNYDLINNTYESNGDYSYNYLGNYINDLLNKTAGKLSSTCGSQTGQNPTSTTATGWTGTLACYANYYQGFGNPIFGIGTLDYGVFAQDNWKVTPRLTLELGVRYDYEFLPMPASALTAATTGFTPYSQLNNHPSDKNNVGPRVGFSYDLYGQGRTVVRGGYGMFYGRVTSGVLLNVLLNTGSSAGQYTTNFKPSYTGAPTLPNLVAAGTPPTPSSYYLASNLQNPMVHEFDLLLQQELGKGTVFSLSYLGALGRELPNFLDLNLNPASLTTYTIKLATYTGTGGSLGPAATKLSQTSFQVPTYTSYGNTALFGAAATSYQTITQVTSNVNSTYNALVAELQNRSLHSLQFDLNYTWSHALDFSQNATTTNTANGWYDPFSNPRINYGNSSYNVPNRLTGYALYSFPKLSGHDWYTYLTNGWNLDTSFQMQNGLPYSANVSGYVGNAIVSDWNGSGGLSVIPGMGINTYQSPRKIVDDVRAEKDFLLGDRFNLQLLAQVFNLANHQNIDGLGTTAYKLGGTATAGTATFQAPTWQVPTSSNNSGFLYTPRQFEIATKLSF
jgi:outer membrane receptor protein involved in Fe transport